MKIRLALAGALLALVGACTQLNAARGDESAAQQAQAPADPALAGLEMVEGGYTPVEHERGGCDFKDCLNIPGRWYADRETPLYAEPRINAEPTDRLAVGEWVNASRYEEHFRPRRAVVTRAGQGLEAGEVIYELWGWTDDEGNSATTFWRRGAAMDVSNSGADQPEVRYEGERSESIIWVYVEREGGRRNGWLRDPMMPGVEGRIDECPAHDVSEPCRNLRSRAQSASTNIPTPQPFLDCADCPSMVWIPGQSFAVSQYEVTIADWNACITAGWCPSGGSLLEGDGRSPASNMSRGADVYVAWLSQKTGHRYRWLTLAEWSAAAFPGGRSQNYYWGNEAPACTRGARNGVAFAGCRSNGPMRVGSFQPNAYGLYDMLGNVAELVVADSESMAFVGGSWRSPEAELGATVDEFGYQNRAEDRVTGLRVARDR